MRWTLLVLVLLVAPVQGALTDEDRLRDCLCSCLEPPGGRFSCSYDETDPGYSPSCRTLSNGPCICKAFGCFRGQMPTSGECYDKCRMRQTMTSRTLPNGSSVTTSTHPDDEDLELKGRITLWTGKPVKYAKVTLKYRGADYTSTADDTGNYVIKFRGRKTGGETGRLYVKLEYHRNNRIYYRILYSGKPVWIMRKFDVNGEGDLTQNLVLRDGLNAGNNHFGDPNTEWIRHFAITYFHMYEVLEFYMDELQVGVDYKLPVDVLSFAGSGGATYYTPTTGNIVIAFEHSQRTHPFRPMNREWHEFGHHVQFSLYRKWPEGSKLPGTENHNGYLNPSTADSFTEGFTEFMTLVIAEHYGYPNPHVYSSFGSLELDHKAWSWQGKMEELAVAGILWDLYDPKNDDQVDLTRDQIWDVIKHHHPDFTSVYREFITKYPGDRGGIDAIFEAHGFFNDTTPGNRVYDSVEPFIDADGDKAYDAGEGFIDYAQEPGLGKPWMIRQENEIIGPASNYQRPSRTNAVRLPGHYVRVDNTVPYYTVEYSFTDSSLDYSVRTFNDGGLVYVQVPEGYNATVSLQPEGVSAQPYTFTAQGFRDSYEIVLGQGYYADISYGEVTVSEEPVPEPASIESRLDEIPYWETSTLNASAEDFAYIPPAEEPLPVEGGMLPSVQPWMLLAGGGVVGLAVLALGAVAVLAVIVGLIVWWRRRKK